MPSSFGLYYSFVIRHSDFVIFASMTPARFQTIEQIYREALEQEPDQISTFLNRACKDDALLRRKVEALLNSRRRADAFIENSAVGLATKVLENQQTGSLFGQTIGHYKISERIGTGGMGEVYLATDVVAGRKAALKLLPVQFTHDPDRLKRFQQEAHAVVALNHPNILTVYEIGEDQAIHYIASELIEGETLRDRLTREPMQLSEALDVAIQVASALAVAHQAGIVHRDIKPENIMLRPDGYVKVLDFGIAKLAEQELPASMPKDEALLLVQTNLGSILGTVRYMSPEQARGAQIDKRTDIWSLGVVLYEMVTGHEPFNGDTARELMSSILETEPPPLKSYVKQTPAELQEMISKTLRKDRDERYGNARELLEALKNLRRKLEFKGMPPEVKQEIELEIAHVLLTDIVGYSKLPVDEQRRLIERLNKIVRGTDEFKAADGAGRLIKIPTGDGIALVFYSRPEAPLECAVQISRSLKGHPQLQLRMGIHSGPVSGVIDVNERANVAGSGMNVAQRVMDCGDAGHILISKHAAEDLEQYGRWRPYLYALGEVEVKHGIELSIFNFYTDEVGNPQLPEKIRRVRARRKAAVLLVVGVSLGVLLSGGLLIWGYQSGHKTINATLPAVLEKSIAVLPLENLSDDKENAFFADGVQDELLSNLSKIKDLKVISRTSVMQYKSDTKRNLKEIAQQLGVNNIVEGSVRRSGDHVRVSMQLIDARSDRHVWAENYDRKVADSVSLQGELATEIASAVGATLTPQEKARVQAKPTNNPAAYDAYLRARAIPTDWGWALKGDIETAIHLYEQAVKLDPNFTLAWAYLSIAQRQSVFKDIDSAPVQVPRAKDSLNHAIALDPNLPEVHLARGYNEEDDTRALAEFRQAEQGLPNSADVLEAIARKQRALGHWDGAVAELRRAIELDPRNISASNNLALTCCAMRRFPEALATLDRVLAWDPTNARALLTKVDALMAIGDLRAVEPLLVNPELPANRRAAYAGLQHNYAAAIEILSTDLPVDRQRRDTNDILALAFNQQLAGDIAAARAIYQKSVEDLRRQLEKVEPGSFVEADTRLSLGTAYAALGEAAPAIAEGQKAMALVPSSKNPEFGPVMEDGVSRIYAQLGDADHAIPMLKRLLRTSYPGATFLTPATLRLDPIWDKIRSDPRFQELTVEEVPLSEKSIAVLPFENLSKDEENAFFAGGVQDEILTNLAKVADLKVISRTSVMKYKNGPERNLREIATALGVSHVVEGSVQRAGGRVRVVAQLIDARNDSHVWAEHYDREFADVFAIQSDIAQQIADQLRAKLSAAEKAAIAERPTADLVAYAYYTQAKEMDLTENWEGDEKNLNRKIELLEKATQRDPNFALAYCAITKTHLDLMSMTGEPDISKHLELAKKAAEAALRVRPDLGEAHLEKARYYFYAFDWERAREQLKIARSKLPNNAEALVIEAMIGRHENRWDASLADLKKAYDLDPRNDDVSWYLGQVYFEMRRYSEWEQLCSRRVANGTLDNLGAQFTLARLRLAQGDPIAAQSLLDQLPLEFGPGPWMWELRFTTALYLRDYDAANRIIADTPGKWADFAFGEQSSSWAEGQVARARGDKQAALAAFATARGKMEAQLGDKPADAMYLSKIAKLDAGVGRKEEAIHEALRAVELIPISKDAVNAPLLIANLALVYAWTGERNHALEQLEKVATMPGAIGTVPTYGDLRFNPCWDDLRGDPRFDKIIAAAKAASR
jgi:TolB-like protein/serine/threonine protein kinase/Tfp pilus assembly protein PilF